MINGQGDILQARAARDNDSDAAFIARTEHYQAELDALDIIKARAVKAFEDQLRILPEGAGAVDPSDLIAAVDDYFNAIKRALEREIESCLFNK